MYHQNNELAISKDTFLTFSATFWELIRKEDEIVERVAWAISNQKKKNSLIYFEGF